MDGFVETCEKVIKNIISIKEITQKQIYSSLENALISNEIKILLPKFSSPNIILKQGKQSEQMFGYVPSLFPHFLYNYSDFTFEFFSKNINIEKLI